MSTPELSVVIPCYNEGLIIEATAERLLQALPPLTDSFEIVLCNDGSKDDTFARIRALAGRHPAITAAGYEQNRGAGYAFREALKSARGRIVMHMDADLAMEPRDVGRECLAHLAEADIAIASRYAGIKADYPLRRRVASYAYRRLYRTLLGLEIQDAMSGFFAFRRELLDAIPPLQADGFEVYLELFSKAKARGFRIREFPALFVHETASGEVSVLRTAPKQFINTLRVWRACRS